MIPKYFDLMPEILNYLSNSETINWKDLEFPIALKFELTDEEVNRIYPSGNGKIFLDRVGWALSDLANAGLIERPKRGYCHITEAGQTLVGNADGIKVHVKGINAERILNRLETQALSSIDSIDEPDKSEITPQEALNQAADDIRSSVYANILDTILSKSPYEFERLVVLLLDHMGYGGQVKNAGTVTQKSNDGGIDGIIKEDVLGLGRIHLQAKRYALGNTISREEVQKFVGALAVAQSNKGVFITTSGYSKGAIEYADSLNGATNLVLIDGEQLAKYIYDFGLGMQTEQTVVIKRLDGDFWDALQDDLKS